MVSRPDSDAELERQRAGVDAAFREGWLLPDVGEPRVLIMPVFAEARRVIQRGGPTSLDQATIQAVRDGAKPGDRLPPRQPGDYTEHVTDAEVIITGSSEGRRVAVLFSHGHFPGVRFGHRFELDPFGGRDSALALRRDIEAGELHHMMEMEPSADSDGITWTLWSARLPGIEHQFAEIETAFREGWRPVGAGKPRVLTERAYTQARQVLDHGGWTGLDRAALEAVRGGARPGDALPPLQPDPYIRGVTDAEVIITGSGEGRRVAVLFSHGDFPGVRFGHRFPLDPYAEGRDQVWLMEEVETGALHRMMDNPPPADSTGVIWTTWGDPATG